ncbi:MAG: hypothetical protein ACOYON_10710 [Fimbriimonas sp.]
MRYFILGPSGERYGPADMMMLNQWIMEGRILPTHLLEAEGTGQRISAGQLPGLAFPSAPPTSFAPGFRPSPVQQAPAYMPSAMQMPDPNAGRREMNLSYICSALSLACSLGLPLVMCVPYGSVVFGVISLYTGSKSRTAGALGANSAVAVAWVCLLVAVGTTAGVLRIPTFF